MAIDELVSLGQLPKLLGVSRATAARYADPRHADRYDFPAPAGTITGRRVWRRADVKVWAKRLPLPAGRPRSRDRDAKSARTPEEIAAVAGEALALREQRTRDQAGRPRGPREPRP